MPLVEIHIKKGQSKEFLVSLIKETRSCIHECLKLTDGDPGIRLTEYEEEFFQMKPPYQIIIKISLFSGRTFETKKALYKQLTENLEQKTGIQKEEVMILLDEHPKENWGIRGGIPANELKLGYKVKI